MHPDTSVVYCKDLLLLFFAVESNGSSDEKVGSQYSHIRANTKIADSFTYVISLILPGS